MNKSFCVCALFSILLACSPPARNEETSATDSTEFVERLHEEINTLISQEARIELLASGFTWSEGPLWLPTENAVIFSDVPENTVYSWSEQDSIVVYLKPSGYTGEKTGKEGANGLILDMNGNLTLCQHGDRQLARMSAALDAPEESYETIAGQFNGKRFNSPNDVTQSKKGTFFFTDPPYGLQDDDSRELDFNGVYKIDSAGMVSLLIDSLTRPNGIGLSPDEKTLYVAVSDPQAAKYYAYALDDDETVTGGRILLDVTSMVSDEKKGLPDGLRVHKSGNLFATGPGGVLVITPEGKHLGTILTGQSTANCTFNEDQSVLYMTAHMHLMRIRL